MSVINRIESAINSEMGQNFLKSKACKVGLTIGLASSVLDTGLMGYELQQEHYKDATSRALHLATEILPVSTVAVLRKKAFENTVVVSGDATFPQELNEGISIQLPSSIQASEF